jgi:SAM-dependent methyltransferase
MTDFVLPAHLRMPRKTFDFGPEAVQQSAIQELTKQFLYEGGISHSNKIHNNLEIFWAREHACYIVFGQRRKTEYRRYLPGRFYTYSRVCELIYQSAGSQCRDALEVGCGSAITSHLLSTRGTKATGLDISGCALQFASALTQEFSSQVTLAQGSWETLPYSDSSFDVVFSLGALEHVPPEQQLIFVEELARVSRGQVIILVPNVASPIYQTMEEKEFATMPADFVYPEETEQYPVDLAALAAKCGLTVKDESALHIVPPPMIPDRFLDNTSQVFFNRIAQQADSAWRGDSISAWGTVESRIIPSEKQRWGWFSYAVCAHQ